MAGFTVQGQQWALDAAFAQYPYLALCTTAPTDTTAGTETTYTGYTRRQTAAADWSPATAAVPSSKSNATTISFPQCSAGTTPQSVQYVEMWSAATGGVRGAWGTLLTPLAVSQGITPSYAPGVFSFTLD